MRRLVRVALCLWLLGAGSGVVAQDFTGLARLDPYESRITDQRGGGLSVDLYLSQAVPYRVFTLDNPRRLVLDFREIDWTGSDPDQLLQASRASDLRFGPLRPGWSRMVVDLTEPLMVTQAGMTVDPVSSTALVSIRLAKSTAEEFRVASGAPPDPNWQLLTEADPTLPPAEGIDDGLLIVALDPGHGGIDPGAERNDLVEADIVLALAREIAESINRTSGMRAVLTRSADIFVPLEERMTIARTAGADIFVSLHADALEEDDVTAGASVYTLSDEAVDLASERMAERHDRGDLLAGVDLSGADDTIATALMDLARQQTVPKSLRFADTLVTSMAEAGAEMNSKPRREAVLAVLNAADFPSVLIEAGFLSAAADRDRLTTAQGRKPIVDGVVSALIRWRAIEEAIPKFGD